MASQVVSRDRRLPPGQFRDYQEQLHELVQAKLEAEKHSPPRNRSQDLDATDDVSDLLAKLGVSRHARTPTSKSSGSDGDKPVKKAPAEENRGQEGTGEEGRCESSHGSRDT